jgi:hypothetical protein
VYEKRTADIDTVMVRLCGEAADLSPDGVLFFPTESVGRVGVSFLRKLVTNMSLP